MAELCSLTLSLVCVSVSPQNVFLTQQGLTQELTLDLLEKFRNPEKLKTCPVPEDEEMEVGQDFKRYLTLLYPFLSDDLEDSGVESD